MLIKLGTPSEDEDEEDDDEEEKEEEGEKETESGMRLTRSPSSLYRRRRGEQLCQSPFARNELGSGFNNQH